jgi:hypothetical protein
LVGGEDGVSEGTGSGVSDRGGELGRIVGAGRVGLIVSVFVGDTVGLMDGASEGPTDGEAVGPLVSFTKGVSEGLLVGGSVAPIVGKAVGNTVLGL